MSFHPPSRDPALRQTDATPEHRRQQALDAYAVVESGSEEAFDDIVKLAAMVCDVPAAMISFLDRNRLWFKARRGLVDAESPRQGGFCDHAMLSPDGLLEVEDVAADDRFAHNTLRIDGQRPRFYAGMPILSPDGHVLGTLCVLDVVTRVLGSKQREGMAMLAGQVQQLLELRRFALEQHRLRVEHDAVSQQLARAQVDLQHRHDELQHRAAHDPLTGLLNRAALGQLRENPDAMARLAAGPYVLMLVDVDHFKQVNDRHGHLLGDRALRAVGDVVSESVREGDVAVRFGGEEFLVVLPSTRLDNAAEVAERIREKVANAALPFGLTVSIGLAAGQPADEAPERVFDRADQALYRAKATGRNRVVIDDTQMMGG